MGFADKEHSFVKRDNPALEFFYRRDLTIIVDTCSLSKKTLDVIDKFLNFNGYRNLL